MRNFKLLAVVGLLWAFIGCGLDNNPISSSNTGVKETGSADITVVLGKVGVLGKIRMIELEDVVLELSAPGEKTLKDTINVSGLANSSANSKCGKKYDSLASLLKTWTIQAVVYDKKGNVIHKGCTKFIVPARETVPVTLNLDADYSILKALFIPIRDSVTRVVLAVDGIQVDDSVFAKQSILGDSVLLSFEYLKVGVAQKISLLAYGTMWGFDTLLYQGDTTVTPKAGVDTRYDVTLQWVGPALPPGGISTMQVALGDVGTTYINGELEAPIVPISFRNMVTNPSSMRLIHGGTFLMGQADIADAPVHSVMVSSFFMDTINVIQAEYEALMGTNPSLFVNSNNPVERVTWYDAVLYCNERSKSENRDTVYTYTGITMVGINCTELIGVSIDYSKKGYRLPTEAEWEYACRAGTTTAYWWGADTNGMGQSCWSNYNSGTPPAPQPVAKAANPWGLRDMPGNVWNWCNDWYGEPVGSVDPTGPATGTVRVQRGGAANNFAIIDEGNGYAYAFLSALRQKQEPAMVLECYGFRCVLSE